VETVKDPPVVYTVSEFCKAHKIGRTTFYKLIADKNAPRLMRIGKRVFITRESAAKWRRDHEK